MATLRSRWGAAAPRAAGEVAGALAIASAPVFEPPVVPDPARVFSTGFPELDAILGPGGLPRGMGLSLRGDLSSGRTTLALRLAAEAQAGGAIVAWLDLAAAFDPVEAVARGVQPEWLVVLTPATPEEGLAIAGALLSGRTVDLLVMDLPPRPEGTARFADRLGRLAALARRAGITLLVLEPPGLSASVAAAVGEGTGIRLELARRAWIRLGRDVVGQSTEVVVARNRAGPPGRRATLRILYADGGERDACLRLEPLLALDGPRLIHAPVPVPGTSRHATAPPVSTAPSPRSRPAAPGGIGASGAPGGIASSAGIGAPGGIGASGGIGGIGAPAGPRPPLRLVANGPDRPGRPAVDGGVGPGRGPRGQGARRSARDAARVGAPARSGGDLPRSGTGG
ncbi:MAG TPA: hypothetical protein VLS93_17990 [Anaeromyxobacteraceae bacterium]|nr:hypothetical protein [Anaeromyxobacteraceae bacterium]